MNGFRAPGTVVTISAADPFGSGVDYIEYSMDPAFATSTTVAGDSTDVVVNTTTTLYYRAVDVVGNVGDPGTPVTVLIDDTAPVVSAGLAASQPPNAAGWYNVPLTVTLTAEDPDASGSGTEAGVASLAYSPDDEVTWITVNDGDAADEDPADDVVIVSFVLDVSTTIWYYATDNVGNFPTAGTLPDAVMQELKVDVVDPTVEIASAEPIQYEYGQQVTVAFTCVDEPSGSGIQTGGCTGLIDGTIAVDDGDDLFTTAFGLHTLTVTGVDNAGNTGEASVVYEVVDTIDPEASIGLPADGTVFEMNEAPNPAAVFDCDPVGGSPVTCEATVNDQPLGSGNELPIDGEGEYILVVTATDGGGNTASATVTYFVADTTAPTVSGSHAPTAPEASGWYTDTVTVTVTGDPGVGTPIGLIEYSFDSGTGPWTAYTGPFDMPVDGAGLAVYFRAWDTATLPNASAVGSFSFDIDRADPTASSALAGETLEFGAVVVVQFSCIDAAPGSGIAACTSDVVTNVDTSTEGEHIFTVSATDNAGNSSDTMFTYFVADTIAPDILIAAPSDGAILFVGDAATAQFTCDDLGGTPLVACEASIDGGAVFASGAVIPTGTDGVFTMTVTAIDGAGNVSGASVVYSVGFNICLQYDEKAPQPATGTVPIKLNLCDSDGNNLGGPPHVLTAVVVIDLSVEPPTEFVPSPNDTGKANQGFKFRAQGGGKSYIYNLNADELDGGTTELTAGSYALGFVVDAEVDISSGVPVLVNPETTVIYFAEFTLKD